MKISVATALPDVASSLRGLDNGRKMLDTSLRQAHTAADVRSAGDTFIARINDATNRMTSTVDKLTAADLHKDEKIGAALLRDLRVQSGTVKVHLDTTAYYTALATADAQRGAVQLDKVDGALAQVFDAAQVTRMRTPGSVHSGADDATRTSGATPHYGSDGLDELGNATRSDRGHVGNDGQGYTDAGEATGAYAHDDYSGIFLN